MPVVSHVIDGQGHPILRILAEQGRRQSWLAAKAGVSRQFAHAVLHGRERPTAAFRRVCAEALGLPESDLFHDATPQQAA